MSLTLVVCLCSFVASRVVHHVPSAVPHLREIQNFVLSEQSPSSHPNQEFGDVLQLQFNAFDIQFDHELYIQRNIYAKDATIHVVRNGEITSHAPTHRAYATKKGVFPRATAYVHGSDNVHAIIYTHDGEIYHLDAKSKHIDHNEQEDPLVLYKYSAVHGYKGLPALSRKLLAVDVWDNCWTGQDVSAKRLAIGIAVDGTYYEALGSNQADVEANINEIISDSNGIYTAQMNVVLSIQDLIIETTPGDTTAYDWNSGTKDAGTGKCDGGSTSNILESIRQFRQNDRPDDAAVWHLMTDCFPAPGTVGVAYVGVLCHQSYGAGLTSYLGQYTWETFAHEIGHNFAADHSFEDGQGTTGGIMDYGDGLYLGEYQFHPYRESQVCAHIDYTMALTGGSTICWETTTVDEDPVDGSTFEWVTSEDTDTPCTQLCGGGYSTPLVECYQNTDGTLTLVDDINCNSNTKPADDYVPCNTEDCTVEICTDCVIDSTCCSSNCAVLNDASVDALCSAEAHLRDAAFTLPTNMAGYMFQGSIYNRYQDNSQSNGGAQNAGYPRTTADYWNPLDAAYETKVDAAVVRQDGDVFLFSGSEYIRYTIGSGQHASYPKLISDGFPGLIFTSDIDAAVSFPGGVYFFKGDQYQLYFDDQTEAVQDSTGYITEWAIDFTNDIDAAVYHWDSNLVDFFRNGYQVTFQYGVGQVASSNNVQSPVFGDVTYDPLTVCPNNCLECSSSDTCTECAVDYKESLSAEGQCQPEIYAVDIPFDDFNIDAGSSGPIQSYTGLTSDSWIAEGNVNGAIVMEPNSILHLKTVPDKLNTFSFHVWVNLNSDSADQQLVYFRLTNGLTGTWTLYKDPNTLNGLTSRFEMGDSVISSATVLRVGEWRHIHADLLSGNVQVSVDAIEVRIPFTQSLLSEEELAQDFALAEWRIGASDGASDGLDATLDSFHLDLFQGLAELSPASSALPGLITSCILLILISMF